jgi:hypothetical protein
MNANSIGYDEYTIWCHSAACHFAEHHSAIVILKCLGLMNAVLLSIALPYVAALLCVILLSVLLNILLLIVILQRGILLIVILQSSVVLSAILNVMLLIVILLKVFMINFILRCHFDKSHSSQLYLFGHSAECHSDKNLCTHCSKDCLLTKKK